jgi:pimeloyl-ACP methyl ester carboxylesterase
MRRAALGAGLVVLGLAAWLYFCPTSLFSTLRDGYLYAIGMRGAYVQVGTHRVHYFTGGEGPPLVLVHGVASRAADAAAIYRGLTRTHRVYALDLLGYGGSDKPAGASYSVAMQAENLRGFLDAVGLRETDVMGVSLGGWIALKVAAEHPERVRRLVLVSSAGVRFPTTLTETSFSASNLEELRASLALQTDRASMLPEFVLRDILRHSRERQWITRRSMRAALSGADLLDGKLQRVTMPVLLVWGTHDRIIPFSVAASLKHELPHARVVALPGCGHLAIIECRDEALQAIEEFWSAVAKPPLSDHPKR